MSLRKSNTNELRLVLAQINDLYKKLFRQLCVGNVGEEVFAALSKNKHEFDSHKEE